MICGPIISTNDIVAQTALYLDCFGLSHDKEMMLDNALTTALCGEEGMQLNTAWLRVNDGPFGVRLWAFDPASNETIRVENRGTDRDAPKVIDFYAPDFDAAIQHLSTQGRNVKSSIAEYTIPDGTMREAHLWGPDNVVSAVISGPEHFFKDFATVLDKTFSEPQSISTPVSNLDEAINFYSAIFDLHPVYEYEIENKSFDALVGSKAAIKLRAVNIGTSTKEPYVGLIDYGKTVTNGLSLKGKTRPPMRGLIGVEILVNNLTTTLQKAKEFTGASILGAPIVVDYPPFGATVSAIIEAPHGVLHHVVQRLESHRED